MTIEINDVEDCDVDGCCHPASYMQRDCTGHVHRACTDHHDLLDVWCQEAFAEQVSDGRAAARFEETAYGHDESDY